MTLLIDPRVLNSVMIVLMALASAAWAAKVQWNDAVYWAAGATITASVTFGHMH